jgi:hypothetical protein
VSGSLALLIQVISKEQHVGQVALHI